MPRGPKPKLGRKLTAAERTRLHRYYKSGRITDDTDPIYVLGLISRPAKRGRPFSEGTEAEKRRLRRIQGLIKPKPKGYTPKEPVK